jgi:hypothetical protein
MKHLKYHPIKEGVGIQRDIDILQDIQDVFINLEDIFEVKVSSSFMKYLGDGVFSVYNTDGKIRNTIKTTGGSYDHWQIIFSGSDLIPPKCEEIYKSSILLINQTIDLTGLELAQQSGVSIVDYRNMRILTANFIDNPSSEIEEVIKKSKSITGLVTFRMSA